MSKKLEELREKIDGIDEKIVKLYRERMDVTKDIAAYKKEKELPVLDAGRERAVLARIGQLAGDDLADYAQSVYRTVMATTRATLDSTPKLFPQRPTVACQGIEGANSQIACDSLFKAPTILYFNTFEHVFKAVESGMCQYGILPIENSTAGSVNAIYDLMTRHNFYIVRAVRLKVTHNLLAKHGVKLEDVREVLSHGQALSQCANFLAGLKNVKATVVENTAVAARTVAQSERNDLAALSSRFCAEEYGLNVLKANVQDQDNNYTRFICISKNLEVYPGADRTSLMMTLPHKPGSLYNVLSKFYALGINLRKLESRPLPDREFEFMFYFDLECSVYAPEMEKLFRDLECESEHLRYLGTYNEAIC